MRVCDFDSKSTTRTRPSRTNTVYNYEGQKGERAPYDTTQAIVDPKVKAIKVNAFHECREMKRCIIHEGVETIEQGAFSNCTSLEALFLPSSLREIQHGAFSRCENLRILPLHNIDIDKVGHMIFGKCDTFFKLTKIQRYRYAFSGRVFNHDQVHRDVLDFYRNQQSPLHKVCLGIHVNAQSIHDCIETHGSGTTSITDHDGMTPLHILAINPHANLGAIFACFEANMNAIVVNDYRGNTPLDYMKEFNNIEGCISLIQALCLHREAHL